jgi:Mlc titration factor MtfA (ptsG expression regulator)
VLRHGQSSAVGRRVRANTKTALAAGGRTPIDPWRRPRGFFAVVTETFSCNPTLAQQHPALYQQLQLFGLNPTQWV